MGHSFDIREALVVAVAVLIGLTFHEFAHGYAAFRLGDDTAARGGRLTLNPLKHIDLVGTLVVPVVMLAAQMPFLVGWAKPVPVRAANLRNPRRGMSLVAAAGPLANLALGASFAALALLSLHAGGPDWLTAALRICAVTNILLGGFNLLPLPPLDGSKVVAGFLPPRWVKAYLALGTHGPLTFLLYLVGFSVVLLIAAGIRALF
ncbi:MAG TPA: site-2 protease family protein [Rhizomicrobium sp.]|nr:site-2 protease family protein [Rhizomicrobium sp.]